MKMRKNIDLEAPKMGHTNYGTKIKGQQMLLRPKLSMIAKNSHVREWEVSMGPL